jgi:hypothetical protein
MPPLLYRRAQAQRVLAVKDIRLQGAEPSLWIRLMEPELLAGAKLLEPTPPPPAKTAEVRP